MSNVRGLADLRSEEKKDSSNEYYAGGANQGGGGSGMAVMGGDDSGNGVDRVIGAARAHTSARQGDSSGPVRPAFTITFWKEGFQVDDGPRASPLPGTARTPPPAAHAACSSAFHRH